MERFNGYSRLLATGAPAPNATVTVYDAGTLNLATVYSDNGVTPLANPFTTDGDGFFFFYAANGEYDIRLSGGGIASPYTWGDVHLNGLISIEGLTGDTIDFATGTSGTDFTITGGGSTVTFDLPDAGAAARGVVSTGAQTFAGAKTFSTPIAVGSGGTGLNASPANGELLIGSGGSAFVLATLTGTANQITVSNGAGSITLATPQNIHSGASPTFAGATLTGMTQNAVAVFGASGVFTSVGPGTNGQVLIGSTGNPPVWASITAGSGVTITPGAGTLEIAVTGTGITTLNTLTGATQTFATGTTGSDFNIVSSGTTHTFHIPNASATARGVMSTGAQTLAGEKTFSTTPLFNPGTGSDTARASGVIYSDYTARGNSGTAETDLGSYEIPADTLAADGAVVRITVFGHLAANGNTKTIKVYFGSTSIQVYSTTGNDLAWDAHAVVIRTGAATQEMTARGGTGATTIDDASPTETLSGAVTVKVTGQGGATDDVEQRGFIVEILEAP
jgi:hypothetical protein